MTHDEAISNLSSRSPHKRLSAARFLARQPNISDLEVIREARRSEVEAYVKQCLDSIIAKLSNIRTPIANDPNDEFDVPEELRRRIRRQAVEWASGMLLHEISSPMGLVEFFASREIPKY